MAKETNPNRITLNDWRRREGLLDADKFEARLITLSTDSIVPVLCVEGCDVEPDGRCEHKCPSIMLALGVI
jgi:hypothetical protein